MRMHIFLLAATLPVSLAAADSVVEEAAESFDAAQCALTHTETMCIAKALAATEEKEPVEVRQAIYGRSGKYYVVTGTPNWLKHTREGKADMVFVDASSRAFIEFQWEEGQDGDPDAVAREGLSWLTDAFGGEPTRHAISWEPFQSGGSIYEACYTTKKNTSECSYSAAVHVAGGTAKVFSISAADPNLAQQVLNIIASLDAPKPVDRQKQGDVLKMPTVSNEP